MLYTDDVGEGTECRPMCSLGEIPNFEIVVETKQFGELFYSSCSRGNLVLGCHFSPAFPWLNAGSSYSPTDDGKACKCQGWVGALCIATCGLVSAENYEIRKTTGSRNIPVRCSEDKRVFGCGIMSFPRSETLTSIQPSIDAQLHTCTCSDTDYSTCYAICGEYDNIVVSVWYCTAWMRSTEMNRI